MSFTLHPLSRCGVLQPGDRILAINGRYTEEMTSDEASHLLRESGQQCVLDVEFDIAGKYHFCFITLFGGRTHKNI